MFYTFFFCMKITFSRFGIFNYHVIYLSLYEFVAARYHVYLESYIFFLFVEIYFLCFLWTYVIYTFSFAAISIAYLLFYLLLCYVFTDIACLICFLNTFLSRIHIYGFTYCEYQKKRQRFSVHALYIIQFKSSTLLHVPVSRICLSR